MSERKRMKTLKVFQNIFTNKFLPDLFPTFAPHPGFGARPSCACRLKGNPVLWRIKPKKPELSPQL
jgi:hypothetical protein